MGFRLLMEYHSFLYIIVFEYFNSINVSVSLWSIIHSYVEEMKTIYIKNIKVFPSPYGVSFILMKLGGVTFIDIVGAVVSVSLWSIIHSYYEYYGFLHKSRRGFPSPYGVSFILIRD